HDAHPRPDQAVEAEPDGPGIAAPLGTVHQGQGIDARAHAYSRGALVGGRGGRQEARPAQLHPPFLEPDPVRRRHAYADRPAGPRAQPGLPASSRAARDVRAGGVLTAAGGAARSFTTWAIFPWRCEIPHIALVMAPVVSPSDPERS